MVLVFIVSMFMFCFLFVLFMFCIFLVYFVDFTVSQLIEHQATNSVFLVSCYCHIHTTKYDRVRSIKFNTKTTNFWENFLENYNPY